MKYFTYELVAATNDWIDQTEKQNKRTEKRFWQVVADYHTQLEELKPRLSKPAWKFFRYGFAETGLHDGRLLSLSVGDGLNYAADGTSPFRINRQRALARVEFLNYGQVYCHVFELQGLRSASMDLCVEEDSMAQSIGDLLTYELMAVDGEYLGLGFLFTTGGEIAFKFRRLVYRRRRLQEQYDLGQVYT